MRRLILGGIAIGVVCVPLAVILTYPTKSHKIEVALQYARLPELPSGAKNVQVETIGGMFSRVFYLRFDAPSEDIDRWLSRSNDVRVVVSVEEGEGLLRRLEYSNVPEWFCPARAEKLRIYSIPEDHEGCGGTVYVDDETSVVFVYTSHS